MDLRVSKLFVQLAFWAAICDAIVITSITIFRYEIVGWIQLVDAIILIALAIFLHKSSRIAALFLVLYQIIFQFITPVFVLNTTPDPLQYLWFVFFVIGLLGTLRYQKLKAEGYGE